MKTIDCPPGAPAGRSTLEERVALLEGAVFDARHPVIRAYLRTTGLRHLDLGLRHNRRHLQAIAWILAMEYGLSHAQVGAQLGTSKSTAGRLIEAAGDRRGDDATWLTTMILRVNEATNG